MLKSPMHWPWTKISPDPILKALVETNVTTGQQIQALERKLEALELEWAEWYDKYRHLYARLKKRVADDLKRGDGEVTPGADELSQRILERRKRHGTA